MTITTDVQHIEAGDAPEMVAILLCCFLFKLGGQITLTLKEIDEIHSQFPTIRFALNEDPLVPQNSAITATLRSRDHLDNDRASTLTNGGA